MFNPLEWVDPLGLAGEAHEDGSVGKNRRQAMNEAKDAVNIPRSQQHESHWVVGDDATRGTIPIMCIQVILRNMGGSTNIEMLITTNLLWLNIITIREINLVQLTFMAGRRKQIQEITTLKQKDTVKLLLINKLETAIFIMTKKIDRLKSKNNARNFINSHCGMEGTNIFESDKIDIKRFLSALKKINSYNRKIEPLRKLDLTNNKDELLKWIKSNFTWLLGKKCYFLFDEYTIIGFDFYNIDGFLSAMESLNGSKDVVLFIFDPDVLVVISDDEYSISYYEVYI